MKNIKKFNELFESNLDPRLELLDYLKKCLMWRGKYPGHQDQEEVGIHIFANYGEDDVLDYKKKGISSIYIPMNLHFDYGSISYAFVDALNPSPEWDVLSCSPGIGITSQINGLTFKIDGSENKNPELINADEIGTREISVSGDNNHLFKVIIGYLLLSFSEYRDRFFITYAGGKNAKAKMPEYSDFIKKYLKYLLGLKIGDPINYDVFADIDDYFKKNPLSLYKIDKSDMFKERLLKRTGIKDYGDIGRKLRSGMI